MAKGTSGRRIIGSRQRRASPYPLPSIDESMDSPVKDFHEMIAKKDWEDAICSVCMEYPHNAVLLLCSSYDKGCRPYMCGTSFRFSNCLDQYKKHTKVKLLHHAQPQHVTTVGLAVGQLSSWNVGMGEVVGLLCPLCRGSVKGWTVVEPAREYLNAKKRNCMQENCSFVGTYKELRKHVRVDHPSARPHKVDPILEQKWSQLEHERERNDVISTIRSSMPGSVVFGDYVIDPNDHGSDSDEEEDFDIGIDRADSNFMNMFLFMQALDSAGNIGSNRLTRNRRDPNRAINGSSVRLTPGAATGDSNFSDQDSDSDEDIQGNGGIPLVNRQHHRRSYTYPDQDGDSDEDIFATPGVSLVSRLQRHGRVLLGRSGRRQRNRDASRNRR